MEHPSPTVRFDPDPQTRRQKIHCKQELIVSSLQRFYGSRTDLTEILPILQGTSEISLRLIDWFVISYSKKNNTSYILDGEEFMVYTNYKSQLKAYSKKLFDPFCRRERIYFQVPGHPAFLTTVGKLNFFRWFFEKKILEYILLNRAEIEKDMNLYQKETNEKRRTTPTTTSTTASSQTSQAESVVTTSTKSSTRRRISKKEPVAAKQMQKHDFSVECRFD
jgi:hypothetical protein